MKPLLATKIVRGAEPVKEWEPAEHHLTHAGQVAFHARMLARIKAAQAQSNVKPIRKDCKA